MEINPESEINEGIFYENSGDFEAAIIGCYSGLQSLHNGGILHLSELTTDNAMIQWTGPSISQRECDEYSFTFSNEIIEGIWTNCFTTISRCNNILSRVSDSNISENDKNKFKGEALFLRAYNYFLLVQFFGDLPIVGRSFRSPDEIFEFNMNRKPIDEVYQLITDDLVKAKELLLNGNNKVRASKNAACTLLAKVYLTIEEYSESEKLLNEVILSGTYSLQEDYFSNFTNGNENNEESIFEIPYLSGNLGEGNNFSTTFTPAIFNMAIFPGNMVGGGAIVPTEDMFEIYETGDRRRKSINDSVLLIDGTYEKSLYGVKFVDFSSGIIGDGGINFTSLRYADVILMYAEVLDKLGRIDESMEYLNQVRKRAGLEGFNDANNINLSEMILKERRVEFFLEGHRWFDLKRTNQLEKVMNDYFEKNNLGFSVENHELLLPIPQREININSSLSQNPGY
ncbi:RagB/SusD family nutrient uptake outer membrane protein [Membranihabitans maritimus]|uniref:RagB/SusD family nutrient uptake outer membrane protein n=1 Tax=Membranihabitans maritimus TaxID=2904244 RepID=UPI001F3A3B0B|nr:RagB/SusD family nutrient uptake outer membrane protein [Membranihabitans maritimus]